MHKIFHITGKGGGGVEGAEGRKRKVWKGKVELESQKSLYQEWLFSFISLSFEGWESREVEGIRRWGETRERAEKGW